VEAFGINSSGENWDEISGLEVNIDPLDFSKAKIYKTTIMDSEPYVQASYFFAFEKSKGSIFSSNPDISSRFSPDLQVYPKCFHFTLMKWCNIPVLMVYPYKMPDITKSLTASAFRTFERSCHEYLIICRAAHDHLAQTNRSMIWVDVYGMSISHFKGKWNCSLSKSNICVFHIFIRN
jgi:hypothetical protein